MTKARVILLVAFLVTLAAGVAAGLTAGTFTRRTPSRSRLAGELKLTSEQREKMRAIWSETMGDGGRRQALQRQRDEAVRAILSEEQRARYEEVMREYAQKSAGLSKERETRFQEAVRKTKAILTEEQRRRYEELLKGRLERERRLPAGEAREPGRTEERAGPRGGR